MGKRQTRIKTPAGVAGGSGSTATGATTAQAPEWRANLLLAVLLTLATLAAFSPAFNGGQLWDDAGHITRPEMQSGQGLYRTWFELGATAQYYPLLHTAFWLEYQIWGDSTFGYHLLNALLHAAAALLLVWALKRLQAPGAWLAGFLFAVHPVAVETVSWMSEQKNTLSAVFYFASALLYLRFDETRKRRYYAAALGLFACALASKSVTATLPFALLVVFWWKRGRVSARRDALPLAPWMALGVAAGLFTAWVERVYVGAHGAAFQLSAVERVLLAGRVAWFYVWKNIWPLDLMFIYPRWRVDAGVWWWYLFPLAAAAALGGLAWWARKRRGPLAAALYLLGTIVPAIGFVNVYPFLYSYVADHFQYLARVGALVPAAWALATFGQRLPRWQSLAGAAALVAALMALSWRQAGIYVDADTHYAATLARNPNAWLAHNNLGSDLLDLPGRFDDGLAHIEAALRIYPEAPMAHHNLGRAYARLGRLEDAASEFQIAIRLQPDLPMIHDELGKTLASLGRAQEAVNAYREAIRLGPSFPQFHNNLGTQLARMGNMDEAAREFRRAIEIEPAYPEAHNNLGLALARLRDLEGAAAEFSQAVRLRPAYVQAHSNLGGALLQLGRPQEAAASFQTALQIDPDYTPARQALAQIGGR